ncbi:Rubredoxin [Nitrosomonas marina]|uniref:Rubredoxin n=2 Tax=Nitrosomonas marina TaxID=917 RepID=A0A1H8A8Q1_9PROT|nr:Rubredoxin [Nitrosomonas marina]
MLIPFKLTAHSNSSAEKSMGYVLPENQTGQYYQMKKYQCNICGFIYDELLGDPAHGIAAGTRWEDIPESWSCPECGVNKADFEMVEI